MSDSQGAKSFITFRMHTDTHALLKAMAGLEGMSMVDLLNDIVTQEVGRRGFTVRKERPAPALEIKNREIVLQGR